MMTSNEPITCLLCNLIFPSNLFSRHITKHTVKGIGINKTRYEQMFNVVLPKLLSWNTGLTKETNASIKQVSEALKGHKIFINPKILGEINKERLTGKSWIEVYGEEKAQQMVEQRSESNNYNWIPREIRICACGCKETFEVRKNSTRRFIAFHNSRGKNNPNWQGGIDKQFYKGFTRQLRKQIRERDGNKCVLCSSTSKKLDVHHIDYNKKNSVSENLITLCACCHSKTNFNREYWQEFFKPIMEKIYDSRI